jgi:hypothetical protein
MRENTTYWGYESQVHTPILKLDISLVFLVTPEDFVDKWINSLKLYHFLLSMARIWLNLFPILS